MAQPVQLNKPFVAPFTTPFRASAAPTRFAATCPLGDHVSLRFGASDSKPAEGPGPAPSFWKNPWKWLKHKFAQFKHWLTHGNFIARAFHNAVDSVKNWFRSAQDILNQTYGTPQIPQKLTLSVSVGDKIARSEITPNEVADQFKEAFKTNKAYSESESEFYSHLTMLLLDKIQKTHGEDWATRPLADDEKVFKNDGNESLKTVKEAIIDLFSETPSAQQAQKLMECAYRLTKEEALSLPYFPSQVNYIPKKYKQGFRFDIDLRQVPLLAEKTQQFVQVFNSTHNNKPIPVSAEMQGHWLTFHALANAKFLTQQKPDDKTQAHINHMFEAGATQNFERFTEQILQVLSGNVGAKEATNLGKPENKLKSVKNPSPAPLEPAPSAKLETEIQPTQVSAPNTMAYTIKSTCNIAFPTTCHISSKDIQQMYTHAGLQNPEPSLLKNTQSFLAHLQKQISSDELTYVHLQDTLLKGLVGTNRTFDTAFITALANIVTDGNLTETGKLNAAKNSLTPVNANPTTVNSKSAATPTTVTMVDQLQRYTFTLEPKRIAANLKKANEQKDVKPIPAETLNKLTPVFASLNENAITQLQRISALQNGALNQMLSTLTAASPTEDDLKALLNTLQTGFLDNMVLLPREIRGQLS